MELQLLHKSVNRSVLWIVWNVFLINKFEDELWHGAWFLLYYTMLGASENCGVWVGEREELRQREREREGHSCARAPRDRRAHVIKSVSLGFGFSVQCSVAAVVSLVWVSRQCHVWIWTLQQLIPMSGTCFVFRFHNRLNYNNART